MGDTVSTLLFQPPPPTKLKEEKVIWLKTRRGATVPAFYISYRSLGGADVSRSLTLEELKKSKAAEGITILYSHANAEDLGSIYPWCKYLSKMLRVNLMAYDYTGYGMAYKQGESNVVDLLVWSLFAMIPSSSTGVTTNSVFVTSCVRTAI